MNAQDTVNQSVDHASKIVQGSQLNTALKTESGKVITDALAQSLVDHLDSLVWDPLSDEDVLRKVYMIRGITGAIEPIGDAIRLAISAIARNAVSQKLRGRSFNQEE